ncbi:MAG: hypothetical protein Kow0010_03900 [Dehalococcoidia bacterium]
MRNRLFGSSAAFGHPARLLAVSVIAASAIAFSILIGRTLDVSAGTEYVPPPHPGIARDVAGDHDHGDVLHFFVEHEGEEYFVEVHFYTVQGSHPDFDAIQAEMLQRFPGATPVVDQDEPGVVRAQYKVNSYWWPSHSATWAYNPSGKPGGLTGDDAAVLAGALTWNNSPAAFTFSGGGTTGAGTGACSGGGLDGLNTVGWRSQSGTVLAVTCTWFTTSTQPFTVVEFDMEFDPRWEWTTGTPISFDVQSVATHEFGHALGLGHSEHASAVMYATYPQGANKQQLTQDDIDGAVAIYGTGSGGGDVPGGSGGSTATPTATNTPTPTPTPGSPPPPPGGSGDNGPSPTPTKTPTPTPTATPGAVPPRAPGAGGPPSPSPSPTPSPTPKANPPGPTPTPIPPPTSVTMASGTSLITWPFATMDAADAVRMMDGRVVAIYGYDAQAKMWLVYAPALPPKSNTLTQLQQGAAYWLFADSPVTVTNPE